MKKQAKRAQHTPGNIAPARAPCSCSCKKGRTTHRCACGEAGLRSFKITPPTFTTYSSAGCHRYMLHPTSNSNDNLTPLPATHREAKNGHVLPPDVTYSSSFPLAELRNRAIYTLTYAGIASLRLLTNEIRTNTKKCGYVTGFGLEMPSAHLQGLLYDGLRRRRQLPLFDLVLHSRKRQQRRAQKQLSH